MNPFDFLNSINLSKKDLFEDPQAEKDYPPFMINRGLSYFPDTIMYANVMNRHHDIARKWQFDFYLNSISRKKRFSKWYKKDTIQEDIKLIMKYYKYSQAKAMEVYDLLSNDQLNHIREVFEVGGRS